MTPPGLRVLWEDARLVAVEKPAGVDVIPARGASPAAPLTAELERRLGRKPYVLHRLDRGTSGVVLFAKDAAAHRDLCGLFARGAIRKTYLAVAQGAVAADGTIDASLRAFGSGRVAADPRGKASRTDYRVLERLDGATLLEVRPHTGRRHQIRAHLFFAGHPVLGDTRYGRERPVGGAPRLMLHALRLEWDDPQSGPIGVACPPPPDFEAVLARLRASPGVL